MFNPSAIANCHRKPVLSWQSPSNNKVWEIMFICDKCGLCCMQLRRSIVYHKLDRGDGICRYFDDVSRLCTIYEERPLICNVDKMYDMFFENKMLKSKYYQLNYESCKMLKKREQK